LADGPHADLPHCGQNPVVDADHQTERPARLVEKNADGRGIQTTKAARGIWSGNGSNFSGAPWLS